MIIHITQSMIDNGVPISCSNCPVAQGINRVLPWGFYANVSQRSIQICEKVAGEVEVMHYHRATLETPPTVANWIEDFDSNAVVRPFSFELEYDPYAS